MRTLSADDQHRGYSMGSYRGAHHFQRNRDWHCDVKVESFAQVQVRDDVVHSRRK